ncbi:mannose-1-phosphate guanylyltransferase (gdp) / mannose-6-phosphate isomerase [hydrocarbon metagenome]|uniref:Mannose-1-phosphate guanylyltransferase (Gdp) / mannose-6-phosphate isomerase n=1 Tax=hydrocarbon metagenome TaxID=938273 RepID=A0A0W8FMW9_9ZZZZ
MKKVTKCPWGNFEVLLDAPDHKVKRIVVEPGGCLSLQLHHLRSEHWFIVSGRGIAIVDGKKKSIRAGSSIDIPKKSKHRVQNSFDEVLVFIEVQTGDYCGDDDIERFEDKYGRI